MSSSGVIEVEEAILKQILEKLSNLEAGQERVEKKLDTIFTHTAALTEEAKEIKEIKAEVEEIKRNLSTVETITANNYLDVSNLKAVFRK